VQVRMSDLRSLGAWRWCCCSVPWRSSRPGPTLRRGACHTPIQGRKTPVPWLLQGNIPQDEKFEPGSGVPMACVVPRAAPAAAPGAGRGPETALPLLPQQLPEATPPGPASRFAQPSARLCWACRWAAGRGATPTR
jgi:apolipoprotein N-acyltransferase